MGCGPLHHATHLVCSRGCLVRSVGSGVSASLGLSQARRHRRQGAGVPAATAAPPVEPSLPLSSLHAQMNTPSTSQAVKRRPINHQPGHHTAPKVPPKCAHPWRAGPASRRRQRQQAHSQSQRAHKQGYRNAAEQAANKGIAAMEGQQSTGPSRGSGRRLCRLHPHRLEELLLQLRQHRRHAGR